MSMIQPLDMKFTCASTSIQFINGLPAFKNVILLSALSRSSWIVVNPLSPDSMRSGRLYRDAFRVRFYDGTKLQLTQSCPLI